MTLTQFPPLLTSYISQKVETDTGTLLTKPQIYLDFTSFSINILFLFQHPIHGTTLHLTVMSLRSPLVCEFLNPSLFFMTLTVFKSTAKKKKEYC